VLGDSGQSRGLGLGSTSEEANAALARLAAVLLPPSVRRLLPDSGDVVLYPHGVLGQVPYAALPLGGDRTLGTVHPLRYGISLHVQQTLTRRRRSELPNSWVAPADCLKGRAPSWLASNCRKVGDWAHRAVVLGDPDMPIVPGSGAALSPLAGARAEAESLAAFLGVVALEGAAASEAAVRARLADASLVHLATHGLAYGTPERARESFVALTPGNGQDGLLRADELLSDPALKLTADLVVLSACQTGVGEITRSEGTVGLQRAFLIRGASSMLVSLWNVSDDATGLLMRRFYERWLGGELVSKAEALRGAQTDVRSDPRFTNPRYWAAFQLIGAP
jgi:CHAT domain-containing protein